jgi:hypothetical protein
MNFSCIPPHSDFSAETPHIPSDTTSQSKKDKELSQRLDVPLGHNIGVTPWLRFALLSSQLPTRLLPIATLLKKSLFCHSNIPLSLRAMQLLFSRKAVIDFLPTGKNLPFGRRLGASDLEPSQQIPQGQGSLSA